MSIFSTEPLVQATVLYAPSAPNDEALLARELIDGGAHLGVLLCVVVSGEDAAGTESLSPHAEVLRHARLVVTRVEEHAIDALGLEPRGGLGGRRGDNLDDDPELAHVATEWLLDVLDGEC